MGGGICIDQASLFSKRRDTANPEFIGPRSYRRCSGGVLTVESEFVTLLFAHLTINSPTTTMATQSTKNSRHSSHHSVGMFSAGEARCDRWQELAHAAQSLAAQSSAGSSTREKRTEAEALLGILGVLETFHAYPGEAMMSALKEALGRNDYSSFSRITNRIAKAIITGSYRRSASAWKPGEDGEKEGNDRLL